MNELIIDLGCGLEKETGSVGLDNVPLSGVDVVHDLLDFPYPFDDSVASTVYLKHVLEHFDFENIQRILNEVYRVLVPGGEAHIYVPHAFSVAAWIDPTHRKAFTFGSFEFFWRDQAKAYYKETGALWICRRTYAKCTLFNWKSYRMRRIDSFLSGGFSRVLNWFLARQTWPGAADLFVKVVPVFFVEVRCELQKPRA